MARFGRGRGANSGNGSGSARNVPFTAGILTALAALCIPIWLLAFLGWCVQLAGMSAVQYKQGRHFLQVCFPAYPGLSQLPARWCL